MYTFKINSSFHHCSIFRSDDDECNCIDAYFVESLS